MGIREKQAVLLIYMLITMWCGFSWADERGIINLIMAIFFGIIFCLLCGIWRDILPDQRKNKKGKK